MTKKTKSIDSLISVILKGIDEVKGQEVQLLDLRKIENSVCDYFIICSGTSNTHVNAITGAVQKLTGKQLKDHPWHVEGEQNAEWVLLDYINVVVHVFQKKTREFYDIEGLWGDATITHIS
ncbi:MAG: ribosome silencing factor [Flavobacteriaceae bacterium]|nr:ribosome silencing factor [Flavobacteriaceae bacterium]